MKNIICVEDVQCAFLAAMSGGYASGIKPPEPVTGLPGWKSYSTIISGTPQYIVTDAWFSNPENYSAVGITTIRCEEEIIWSMQYGGWYKPEAQELLKAALFEAYSTQRVFNGGRGPAHYEMSEGRLMYLNQVELPDFHKFKGTEFVIGAVDGKPKQLGYHWYRGGLMTTEFA